MKAVLIVIFVVIGSAYCRSLPVPSVADSPAPSVIDVASVDANPAIIVRKARQFGKKCFFFLWIRSNSGTFSGFNYNNYDYNPYNDTPNNYDNNPYNDSPHRQTYNNFDLNPFNDSYNNYDANPYNNSGFFGNLFGRKK